MLNCYRFDLDYSRDQVDEMALRYAWGELTGTPRTIGDDLAGLEGVTPENFCHTVNALSTPANLRAVVVGPYRTRDRKAVELLLANW